MSANTDTDRDRRAAALRNSAVEQGLLTFSGFEPLLRILLSLSLVAACYALAVWSGQWYVIVGAVLAIAYLYLSLPAIAHEAVHGHVAHNATVNRIAGILSSAIAIVPYSTFRYFHLEHHAHTATARDSEMYPLSYTRRSFLVFPFKQMTFVLLLWKWSLGAVRGNAPPWIRDSRQAADVRFDMLATGVFAVAASVVVLLVGHDAWIVWPAPLPVAALLYSCTVTPEHFGARLRARPTRDQLGYTASIRSNWPTRGVVWNSNFHAAHHFIPSVAAKNLPKVDRLISDLQPADWRFRGYISWYRETFAGLDSSPWNAPLAEQCT